MTALRPARRSTTADQVEAALLDAITDGRLPPGAPLRLQQLATDLGVSMMPVREALRRLEALAMVEIQPHRGAWVRPLTRDDLRDTYFTRLHLETLALRHGVGRFTAERAAEAEAALQRHAAARAAGDHLMARDAHERFHFLLYEASGSGWLMRSIRPAWRNSERYRIASMRHPEHARARAQEHREMLDALRAGDGDRAVALLVRHLRTSADLVADSLGGGPLGTELAGAELP